MRYLSVLETAKKWNISERSVRNYCAQGRVNGAFLTGKTWNIPEKGEVSDDTTEDEKANASNDKKDNDKETTESPKTGDTANVWGYLICAGASIIVILEITFRKRLLR